MSYWDQDGLEVGLGSGDVGVGEEDAQRELGMQDLEVSEAFACTRVKCTQQLLNVAHAEQAYMDANGDPEPNKWIRVANVGLVRYFKPFYIHEERTTSLSGRDTTCASLR